jgi:hypothetical protein
MRAYQKQNKKRRTLPRLPTGYLSYQEYVLLERAAEKHGSKKAAIVAGLRALDL